jgi:hypothetical protein
MIEKGGIFQMKKRVTVILTVLMVLAMSTTVFAAGSPTTKTDPVQPTPKTTTAVKPAVTVPTNKVSGLSVAADASSSLPAGATLTGEQVTSGETYEAAASIANTSISGLSDFAVYNLDVFSGTTVVHQLDGYVQISLPVPANLTIPAGKDLVVYRCEDDGRLTKCDTTVANGTVTFSTDHFSTYIFAVTDASSTTSSSPKTGETSTMVLLLAIATVGACAGYKMRKRA